MPGTDRLPGRHLMLGRTAPRRLILLASVLAVVALAGISAPRVYRVACDGALSGFEPLAQMRDASIDGAGSSGPLGRENIGVVRFAASRAAQAVLAIKQADIVAFPLHAITGLSLELTHCSGPGASVQWQKAALHAWSDQAAELAAAGLSRTLGREQLRPAIEAAALDNPWYSDNLLRTEQALHRL